MCYNKYNDTQFKLWLFERYLRDNSGDSLAEKIRDAYLEKLREIQRESEKNSLEE